MRMRNFLLLALLAAGGSLLWGCSNTSVCQDGCEKRKKCAQSLDCTKVPPGEKAGCENAKDLWSKDDCSTAAIPTCAGREKDDWVAYNNCSKLDNFCKCKESTDSRGGDILCRRPPSISECSPPPNKFGSLYWYCPGCGDCEGSSKAAACSLINNNDCRFFATSCIPKTYGACDGTGSDQLQFLCGYCFFAEAGPARLKECDHIGDLGPGTPRDAGKKQ